MSLAHWTRPLYGNPPVLSSHRHGEHHELTRRLDMHPTRMTGFAAITSASTSTSTLMALALALLLAPSPGSVSASAQADQTQPPVSERARKIHAEGILWDGHNDLPWRLRTEGDMAL